jgi:type I restriction enzyme S subunit
VAFTSKGTIGRFARVTEFTQPFVYSPQVCFWRSLDRHRLEPAILYCWMQSDDLRSQISAVAGQTDMAPYVSLRDQRAMEVPVFPASQAALARRLGSLFRRQALTDQDSKSLIALRDALLPKLISGEVRVKCADTFVEQASLRPHWEMGRHDRR